MRDWINNQQAGCYFFSRRSQWGLCRRRLDGTWGENYGEKNVPGRNFGCYGNFMVRSAISDVSGTGHTEISPKGRFLLFRDVVGHTDYIDNKTQRVLWLVHAHHWRLIAVALLLILLVA